MNNNQLNELKQQSNIVSILGFALLLGWIYCLFAKNHNIINEFKIEDYQLLLYSICCLMLNLRYKQVIKKHTQD